MAKPTQIILVLIFTLFFLSYAFAGVVTVFNNNFNDGLIPAGWTQAGAGTSRYTNKYWETTDAPPELLYKQISITDKTIISLAVMQKRGLTIYSFIGSATGDPDTGGHSGHIPTGNGYAILCGAAGNSGLYRAVAGVDTKVIASASTCAGDTNFRADRNSDNGWTLYTNGTAEGWYNETAGAYDDFEYSQSYVDEGGGGNKIDDWNFIYDTGLDRNALTFNVYDENTNTLLSGVSVTLDGNTQTTGAGGQVIFDSNSMFTDANVSHTISIGKTNYLTRFYQADFNKRSNETINFVLLPSSLGSTVSFKFFETDLSTLLSNADIRVTHTALGKVVERLKTNANAEADFNLNVSDGNYVFNIKAEDGTQFVYSTVSLTIGKPKAEATGTTIDANWNVYLSGVGASNDVNLTVNSKVLAIYSETVNSYIATISSNNISPEYYPRSYQMRSFGNQALTLQPYLASTDDATQIKLVTSQDNGTEIKAYPYITIKIYKLVPIVGKALMEQVVTDIKGEALVYLGVGNTYEFQLFDSSNTQLDFDGDFEPTINVAGATIYFTIDTSGTGTSYVSQKYWAITWNPVSASITKLSTGTKAFGFTISNPDGADMNIVSIIKQNDTNFRVDYNISSATTFTVLHSAINWADINKGIVQQKVILIVDGNTYIFIQNYSINTAFGGYYNPIEGLKSGIRGDFGCSATGVCFPTLLIAVIICTGLVVFISLKTSMVGGQGSAAIFVIGLAGFTYLTWVPLELTLVVTIIIAAFIINDRGGRGEA
jgi:hypothetical protein